MYNRFIQYSFLKELSSPYVQILFGARQTGKSTFLKQVVKAPTLFVNLADPEIRNEYLMDAGLFLHQCRALPSDSRSIVIVDEAQTVPSIFDAVQTLYDANPQRWKFILCGSSARKLRKSGANLLPGRALLHHLFPLVKEERPFQTETSSASTGFRGLPALKFHDATSMTLFAPTTLEDRLLFGDLPGIAIAKPASRTKLLKAYSIIFLEEEIRREATIRDWSAFLRFLQLAAMESGGIVNYANISRQAGIAIATVKAHYQLLEDMFVGVRIDAFSQSPRKSALSSPKFLFFDLGVRNAAAGLVPDENLLKLSVGTLFEQWVGLELWKRIQYLGHGKLTHFRTSDGAEIDFVIEWNQQLIPIEVKATVHPTLSDAKTILRFLQEMPKRTDKGYVICRCHHPVQLHDRVVALPIELL